MISNYKFRIARQANARVWTESAKQKRLCANDFFFLSEDLKHANVNTSMSANRKNDDIIAATIIGAIPVNATNGVDAYSLSKKEYKPVEVKLAMVNPNSFKLTKTGCLNHNAKSPDSAIKGSFEIVNNKDKKDVLTALVIVCSETWAIVDVLYMEGSKIVELLDNQECKKRAISVAAFRKYGWAGKSAVGSKIGWDKWIKSHRNRLLAMAR